MQVAKAVNLAQLQAELAAAGIPVNGLGLTGTDLHTYDTAGVVVNLPAAAAAVVASHVAQPTAAQVDQSQRAADIATLKVAAGSNPALAAVARLIGAT